MLDTNSNIPVLDSYSLKSGVYLFTITVSVNVTINATLNDVATNFLSNRLFIKIVNLPIDLFIIRRSKNK